MNRFNLPDKLMQETVINRIKEYMDGKSIAPIVVEFDCTTACNLPCHHCIHKEILGNSSFSRKELIDYAQVLHKMDIKAIILTGGGEPLMNPDIDLFIQELKAYKTIQIGLITNGILLLNHAEVLYDINWIRISMDAANSETFFKLKQSNDFDFIIKNIESFSKIKKCTLGYSFLVIKNTNFTNINDIYAAAYLAKKIGCDYFELKLQFEDIDYNHPDIQLSEDEIKKIREELDKANELTDANFTVYVNSNILRIINGSSVYGRNNGDECYICNLRTVITPKGLYTCSYHRGHEQMKYGTSRGKDFNLVWFSNKRTMVNQNIVADTSCNNCGRGLSNRRIAEIITNKQAINSIVDFDLFI